MKNIEDQGVHQTHKKLCGFWPKNCSWSGYKLGKNIVKTQNYADELLSEGECFDTVPVVVELPHNPIGEMPLNEVKGLDLMFNHVWSSIEDENVGIIGLYGIGGVGKTTLLKRIYNEFGKRKHEFDIVLWVVVSRDYDINKIMNDIHNRLGIDDKINEVDQKAGKIYSVLKNKRFVLMLDDIWEKVELEKIGIPDPRVAPNNSQCKILFTTRLRDVCEKMQAKKKMEVQCLLEEEAYDLFCKNVGEETLNSHMEIPKVAKEMAEECGGLPLALVTLGSALSGVKSVEAWRQARSDLGSSPWIASDMEKKVFSILKFSYDRLPDEAHRNCFLHCALYPEDYEMDVRDLIDGWIGEGLFGKEDKSSSVYDMYEQGICIIEKLKLSCLLEHVEYEGKRGSNYEQEWRQCSVKMHDVIRDMALWLARDEDRNKEKVIVDEGVLAAISESDIADERLNAGEKISIFNNGGGISNWKVPICSNLFSLSIKRGKVGVEISDYSNLHYMMRLKVLDLSGCPNIGNVPPIIGELINLEFLNLSITRIRSELPMELKNLKKLGVLLMEFGHIHLGLIPSEVIQSFKQLKVFRYSCSHPRPYNRIVEVQFLEMLERLPKLEELCIELESWFGMLKLLESTKLQSCLRELCVNKIFDAQLDNLSVLLSSLPGMKNLQLIHLAGVQIPISITNRSSLQNLRWVFIFCCHRITELTWLRYAPLVECLYVNYCRSLVDIIVMMKKEAKDEEIIFPNLKRLFLECFPELKSIYERPLPFPHLQFIRITTCPNLTKLPLSPNSASDSPITFDGDLTLRLNTNN